MFCEEEEKKKEEEGKLDRNLVNQFKNVLKKSKDKSIHYSYASSETPVSSFKSGEDVIKNNLHQKYMTSKDYYNAKVINDIIYNEETHIVSVFKDYLIYDDISEFLRRLYPSNEISLRIKELISYQLQYSVGNFPNYFVLSDLNMFMYKHI